MISAIKTAWIVYIFVGFCAVTAEEYGSIKLLSDGQCDITQKPRLELELSRCKRAIDQAMDSAQRNQNVFEFCQGVLTYVKCTEEATKNICGSTTGLTFNLNFTGDAMKFSTCREAKRIADKYPAELVPSLAPAWKPSDVHPGSGGNIPGGSGFPGNKPEFESCINSQRPAWDSCMHAVGFSSARDMDSAEKCRKSLDGLKCWRNIVVGKCGLNKAKKAIKETKDNMDPTIDWNGYSCSVLNDYITRGSADQIGMLSLKQLVGLASFVAYVTIIGILE